MEITVYILAKNEEANLEKCLESLVRNFFSVQVWDSGSTDGSLRIAEKYAVVEKYDYKDHHTAYRDIIENTPVEDYCIVIDADMIISDELAMELKNAAAEGVAVAKAPVRMFWAGYPLRYCSQYPPKPILFRGGKSPFVLHGHGETLSPEVPFALLRHSLDHDDRKPYERFLQSQCFYSAKVVERHENLRGKQWLRQQFFRLNPFAGIIVFLYIYLVKGGFRDKEGGYLYAFDIMMVTLVRHRYLYLAAKRRKRY